MKYGPLRNVWNMKANSVINAFNIFCANFKLDTLCSHWLSVHPDFDFLLYQSLRVRSHIYFIYDPFPVHSHIARYRRVSWGWKVSTTFPWHLIGCRIYLLLYALQAFSIVQFSAPFRDIERLIKLTVEIEVWVGNFSPLKWDVVPHPCPNLCVTLPSDDHVSNGARRDIDRQSVDVRADTDIYSLDNVLLLKIMNPVSLISVVSSKIGQRIPAKSHSTLSANQASVEASLTYLY